MDSLLDHLQKVKPNPLTIRVYAAELVRGSLSSNGLAKTVLTRIYVQMNGLEVLHELRIIHCDLKPDNILVAPDGHLVITDFGLSVAWLDPRYCNYPSYTFRGRRLVGTDGYIAPEVAATILDPMMPRRGNFGFAADIWSLGLIFAELGMGGRRFISLEEEEEKECWKNHFDHFALTMALSQEMLRNRIKKYLGGDHAMLVERVRAIP